MSRKNIGESLSIILSVMIFWTLGAPSVQAQSSKHMTNPEQVSSEILFEGIYDDKNPSIIATNGWTNLRNTSAYKGSHKKSIKKTDKINFTFNGTQLKLMYTGMPESGTMLVKIDGKIYKFNSRKSTTKYKAKWTSPTLSPGLHTVIIQKRYDDKKPIFIDGLIILDKSISSPPSTPSPTTGKVYYVSPTGSDLADGSQYTPWKSIQKAADTVPVNSTVIVSQGNYPERVTIKRSGITGSPIIFQAQGIVAMRGFTISGDSIVIRGFDITDTANSPTEGWGIWSTGGNCVIEDNNIHDATRGGIILFYIPGGKAAHDCIVRNNKLYGNAFAGIEIHGQNHLIEYNDVWGTIQHHPKWIDPPNWIDADGIRFHGTGHIFRSNYIHDINYGIPENINPHIDCFQTFSDGSYHEAARNIIFEGNRCENMQAQTPQEVGKAFMLENADGLIIRNNILQAYRIIQGINTDHLIIINNIFANKLNLSASNSPSMITLTNTPNSIIKNNIFFNPLLHVIYFADNQSKQGISIGNNNAYRSDGKNVTSSPFNNDIWNTNPLFVNASNGNFHLQANSPLIDTGADLSLVTTDFDGIVRPQGAGHDIGAYEWMP